MPLWHMVGLGDGGCPGGRSACDTSGWEELTPLDVAARSGATDVITWLHGLGARTASDLRGD